tara:strand:- start:841 stop:1533 length:693 start_codon:yes stop_codon:yes gene_type:complete
MALPVIDTPTFELEIPGMKGKFKFRPFLVKENKILTLAAASENSKEMYLACCQVVENCAFGKITGTDLAMYQLQWIFLKLRSKSIGDLQSFTLKCGECNDMLNYEMDINDFELVGNTETAEKKIELSDDTGIMLKYPSAEIQMLEEEISDTEILLNSISYIYTSEEMIRPEDETVEEMVEFIDNLPVHMLNDAKEFFSNIPSLVHKVQYTCSKCEAKNEILINGYEHFFA